MSDNNGEVGAFLAGFVIGALVGAATALVLAPQTGAQTRSTLAARREAWRSTGTERLAQFGSAISDARSREGDGHNAAMPRILLNRDKGPSAPTGNQGTGQETDPDQEGGSPASG